jgi:hypothetical protein
MCTSPPLPKPFTVGVGQSVLSPDGRQLYEPAANQINTYTIANSDAVAPVPGLPVLPDAKKPEIKSLRLMRKGRYRGKYRVKVRVLQGGAITARFEGRLKRGAKLRALSKTAKRAATKAGIYTLYVKPSATARKRMLRAKLVVRLAPAGYSAAQASKTIKLR